jgi:hypothetical protein
MGIYNIYIFMLYFIYIYDLNLLNFKKKKEKKLKFIQILMITMDCLLEVLSAALLIIANIYCSGDPPASLIYFTNINFSKLKNYYLK